MITDGLLDTSNYPTTHPLFSNNRKAKLGCVKDESKGDLFSEWILLRPKCYSMKKINNLGVHKRAKGIQRSVVASEILHEDYKKVFESGESQLRMVRGFQSKCHNVSTFSINKKALSIFEDKRAWIDNNESLAYGHYRLEVNIKC